MKISNVSLPQWSKDIKSLRSSLRVSQSAFGKSLRFSAMAVSRWERGEQPPPATRHAWSVVCARHGCRSSCLGRGNARCLKSFARSSGVLLTKTRNNGPRISNATAYIAERP